MFITFEGIEGSGKTTQIRRIGSLLTSKNVRHVITREPGGTPIGKKIRSILLDSESKEMNPSTELLLYTADRKQHIMQVIAPSLQAGDIVLCDRYFDATLVYQGYARGLDIEMIKALHQLACSGLVPDMTFLFDLPPADGLSRAWQEIESGDRNNNETRFEEEALLFHEKVRSGYLKLASLEPTRFHIIDASKQRDDITEQIISILFNRIDI
jgi:dTMP kinase